MKPNTALKRRIAPAIPLTLEVLEEGNLKRFLDFKLAFDFNAAAAIREKTGLSLLNARIWSHVDDPNVVRVMFWAATHAHHPEYKSDEGLEVIGSFMDESNNDQISEALWNAYLAYLPKEKREFMVNLRKQVEEAKANGEKLDPITLSQRIVASMAETTKNSASGPSPVTISDSASKNSAA